MSKPAKGKKASPRPASKKAPVETKPDNRFFEFLCPKALPAGRQKNLHLLIVALLAVAFLLPFANKAFNIDDPLFIWTADQIRNHPGDFYGFQINWYGTELPAYEVQKNPPLTAYYIALIQGLFGSGEWNLHLAFLLPAIGAALGIYSLAGRLCSQPFLATVFGIITPAFLVSSNTVMCDIMMLCFWVWALYFWIGALESGRAAHFLVSAILISLSMLTKYFGVSLILLLFVYTLYRTRAPGRWLLHLSLPLLVLGLYCWITYRLYGYAHFLEVFSYAQALKGQEGKDFIASTVTGLAFVGGGFISAIFYWPFSWKKIAYLWVVLIFLFSGFLSIVPAIGTFPLKGNSGMPLSSIIQIALFAIAGLSLLALTVTDLVRYRDSNAVLLSLWVSGTVVFSLYLNWTINIRTVLPMAPALGIILVRSFESDFKSNSTGRGRFLIVPLLAGVLLSLSVAWGDYCLAGTSKKAAREIAGKYLTANGKLWFQGHWGFQYYMERYGGRAVDRNRLQLKAGDLIVTPSPLHNSNVQPISEQFVHPLETMPFQVCRWISLLDYRVGAGFYSSLYGPLPYVFGASQNEIYEIARLKASATD